MIKYNQFKKRRRFAVEQIIPALQKVGLMQKAKKLILCGYSKNVVMCSDCNSAHFNGATSCKDKFCPVCQVKRSLLWITKALPICKELLSRGCHLVMLTLTIRTTKDMSLKHAIDILRASYRYMTHEEKRYSKIFNSVVLGGIRSLEVKKGEDEITRKITENWHPHYHILICTDGKMRYKDMHRTLLEIWNNSVKHISGMDNQYCGSVNLRSFKNDKRQDLVKSLHEVFKYMTKFNWQGEDVYELVTTLHAMRMQNSFGNFKYLISDAEIEKDMNKSITEVVKTYCAVCGGTDFCEINVLGANNISLYDLQHEYLDDITYLEDLEDDE